MAIVTVRRRRTVVAAVLALAATVAVVVPSVALADPGATPSSADIQKQLGQLALQNSELDEQFNQATIAATKAETAATSAKVAAAAAERQFQAVRTQWVRIVQDRYENNNLGAAGALFSSDSGSDYLATLNSMNVVSAHMSQEVGKIEAVRDAAVTASTAAGKTYAAAKAASDAVNRQRAALTAQIAKYQQTLNQLDAQQQATYLRAQAPSVDLASVTNSLPTSTSPAALAAVKFALAQVGKPYVYGAAGPSSYDCSGLTMQSWAAAGVSLPHSAAGQYGYGSHVSLSDLSPGDLIFFYHPISHVTIYIGNGYMVSAPTSGEDVMIVPVAAFNGQIVGATHIG